MQINKDLIHGKIDIIERNLTFLDKYKEKDEVKILDGYKDIQAIKYSLFEIIEASIDIASHIISAKAFQRAESYAEIFEILNKNNLIGEDLSLNLVNMARLRNVLVHRYSKMDDSRVLMFIKERLIDVENYIKEILNFIKIQN